MHHTMTSRASFLAHPDRDERVFRPPVSTYCLCITQSNLYFSGNFRPLYLPKTTFKLLVSIDCIKEEGGGAQYLKIDRKLARLSSVT